MEVAASFYKPGHLKKDAKAVEHPKCVKETWIEKLPKALIYSLNRVEYDKTAHKIVKNGKKFEFDKMIYADRFITENKNSERKLDE